MLVVATLIASVVSITRGDSAYVAVIVWAYVGIALKHSDTLIVRVTASLSLLSLQPKVPPQTMSLRTPVLRQRHSGASSRTDGFPE